MKHLFSITKRTASYPLDQKALACGLVIAPEPCSRMHLCSNPAHDHFAASVIVLPLLRIARGDLIRLC